MTPSATVRLAITVGDPAGIGPEIALRALQVPAPPGAVRWLYGPVQVLRERADRFSLPGPERAGAELVDVALRGPLRPGEVSAVGGHAAADAVRRAVEDAWPVASTRW